MTIVYLKFQRILYILRVLGTFTNTWPLYPDIGKNEYILRNIYYYVAIFILMAVWIPMVIGAYKNRNDVGVLMKNMSHIAAFTEAILNSILCRIKKKQLQDLVVNIEKFVKVSKNYEKAVLQKYMNRYGTFISTVAISFVMAGITVICAPMFLPLEFPIDVWYPFSTKPPLLKFILYFMQIFVITHTVFCIGVDVMIAVILFYSSAKLEILTFEIQRTTNEIHLISCIRKHQEITKFISKTQYAIQHILFKTTLTMGFTVISGCFPMLYIQSHVLIPQFLSMIMAALQRMYITAWAANDLKEISIQFTWSVYSAPWICESQKVKSNIFMILQGSQKPILISMSGLLPALTLEYFASFLTSVLSYFMTMRAAITT
ncbi:Odorant receptor Or2 [Trachymyrmex septentrionalis]|uniref:Odorant receptor n=1 Tax=Trachymyrmex septentrionalis TaxID=34720 RepID=A0A195FRJ6_9HYME|nr:Odorant receptor Or2 [Trachymyrmex septentrionalis]